MEICKGYSSVIKPKVTTNMGDNIVLSGLGEGDRARWRREKSLNKAIISLKKSKYLQISSSENLL